MKQQTWFTSDFHFCHFNIIRYCNRPFTSVEEMNSYIIEQYNKHVQPNDIVYYLGDFGLAPIPVLQTLFKQLRGRKILIKGNHDKADSSMTKVGFQEIHKYLELKKDGLKLFLSHVPMYSAYHNIVLCGHVHMTFHNNGHILNVGVDVNEWAPINWELVKLWYEKGYLDRAKFKSMEVQIDGEA